MNRLSRARLARFAAVAMVLLVLALPINFLGLQHHHTIEVADALGGATLIRIVIELEVPVCAY